MTPRRQLTGALVNFYSNPVARVSLELFLTIGTVIFFGIFAIRPTLVTMSNLIKELEEKRALDTQLSQKIAALSSVQGQYAQLETRTGVLDESIPSQPFFKDALKTIEKIASDNKLVIASINAPEVPEEVVATGSIDQLERVSLPLIVTVTGDYPTIRAFVEAIRQARRSMIVDDVIFSVRDERGRRVLNTAVTINLQYFRTKKAAPKTAAKNPPKTSVGDEL